MRRRRSTSALLAGTVVVLALALVPTAATAKSGDGTRSFNGTVSSVAKDGKSLTIKRAGGSRVRFVVRSSTTFEHVSRLSQLSKGTPVEVHAFRSGDRWVATRIEANPGRGGGGDGSGGGSDDY
jgi:hypothetical protein